jgi:hypothetical protein
MPIAVCLIRTNVHYRHDAFVNGLAAAGYTVRIKPIQNISRDDILVIWNRGQQFRYESTRHEKAGSRIIVAENGYTDAHDGDGHQWFSLALDHHNGCGTWWQGETPRFPLMRQNLRPWRAEGEFILALPQRGIGAPGVAMPASWPRLVVERLKKLTRREIRVRPHPGLKSLAKPLAPALAGCHAVVTWGSGAAIKAIMHGVPAFYELPGWIGAPAARFGFDTIENPFLGDRGPMLERLAWSQWTVAEIASGEAIRTLLKVPKK